MSRARLDVLFWPERSDPALMFVTDGNAYAVAALPAARALSDSGCDASARAMGAVVAWGRVGDSSQPIPDGWRAATLAEFCALCDPALFATDAPAPAVTH